MITKPMLAEAIEDSSTLVYPVIGTPKVDGIRCLRPDDERGIVARSFLPIPNNYTRNVLKGLLPVGSDGELFNDDNFQKCTSDFMSEDGEPDFTFCMFDYVADGDLEKPYVDRLADMLAWYRSASPEQRKYIKLLPWKVINNEAELRAYEKECLDKGFEGVIVRDPYGPYKCGRSTLKQGWMLKLKIFLDSEAEIVGFEEMMHNANELKRDALGYAKRSTAKAGKVPMGKLGKFIVRDIHGKFGDVTFKVGTFKGMTHAQRKETWENRNQCLGLIIKYKYQPHGVKIRPRSPVGVGFRHPRDMS